MSKINLKMIFTLLLVFVGAMILIGFLSDVLHPTVRKGEGWKIISQQSYVRDGKKCMGYRVFIDHRADSSERKEIFNAVTNDSYYLHTVWFYLDETAADGSDSAWETLEESAPGYVR